MKNVFIRSFVFFLLIIQTSFVIGQTKVDMWESLYKDSKSIKEKRDMMKKISERATKEFDELIQYALREEAVFPLRKTRPELPLFEEWVYYTLVSAKNIKINKGSDQLKLIYRKVENPLYRGEILYAIGMIGDKSYLPWLNSLLIDINNNHRNGDFKGEEENLYGLIKGLEFYKDTSSFAPLFYTAIPNYDEKIRELAQQVLLKITDDPAPLCSNVIFLEQDPRIMLEALNYAYKSKSSDDKKIKTCKIGLMESSYRVVDRTDSALLLKLRNESVFFLGELKARDPEIIEPIRLKWEIDQDVYSRLTVVEALQKIGSDDTNKFLINRINEFVDKKLEGEKTGYEITDGNKVVIAIIRALGIAKVEESLQKLYKITLSSEFENIIKQEAKRSIEMIE